MDAALWKDRANGLLKGLDREHPTVGSVLDGDWWERLRNQIANLHEPLPDGPFQLLRILTGELGEGPILLPRLESALRCLRDEARHAGRLRPLRETEKKLAGTQINQTRAAIFEILVASTLVQSCHATGLEVELFPRVGDGSSNIELRFRVGLRWCNVEAKALGYSKHDYLGGESGIFYHSDQTQRRQIEDAIDEKVSRGRQLACVPVQESTVIALALGYNAMPRNAPALIDECLRQRAGIPSGVWLWQGYACQMLPLLVRNPKARCPLNDQEVEVLRDAGLRLATIGDLKGVSAP